MIQPPRTCEWGHGPRAFAAFVLRQLVLAGVVLASREVTLPPEVEYLLVSALGVVGSFGLGALALRLLGVSRIV